LHTGRCLGWRRQADGRRFGQRVAPKGIFPAIVVDRACLPPLPTSLGQRWPDRRHFPGAEQQEAKRHTQDSRLAASVDRDRMDASDSPGNRSAGRARRPSAFPRGKFCADGRACAIEQWHRPIGKLSIPWGWKRRRVRATARWVWTIQGVFNQGRKMTQQQNDLRAERLEARSRF
jgi:hypothetical protein